MVIQEPIYKRASVMGLSMKQIDLPSPIPEIAIPRQKESRIHSFFPNAVVRIAVGTAIDSPTHLPSRWVTHRAVPPILVTARSTSQYQEMPKRRETKKTKTGHGMTWQSKSSAQDLLTSARWLMATPIWLYPTFFDGLPLVGIEIT